MNQLVQDPQLTAITKDINSLLLTISFDINQQSDQLIWEITPDAKPVTGPDSGGIAFTTGDTLGVEIVGYGKMGDYSSFQVVDCVIVTRPHVVQIGATVPTLYSPPSPFVQSLGANYPLQLDFNAVATNCVGKEGKHRMVQQHWKHMLNINHAPGSWELSLVLTVRIMRGQGHVSELRVFSFDPECTVGDGTSPTVPGGTGD